MNTPNNLKEVAKQWSEVLATKLEPLRPFVKRISTLRLPVKRYYSSYLRASFVKSFEFVDFATKQQSDDAFFLAPALRGITEDVIYFRFLSRFPDKEREKVVHNLHLLRVHNQVKQQSTFFLKFRPFQLVVSKSHINKQKISGELLSFWQANGWPHLNRLNRDGAPAVREIAEKSDPGILEIIYDFIYRLTSGLVHFNPQVLLRSGWGYAPAGDTPDRIIFSCSHMGHYYLELSQVYGSYLLCLYFELFDEFLRPNKKEKAAVTALRVHILERYRWPEIVTYEEMNFDPPIPWPHVVLKGMYDNMMEKGFIQGAKEIIGLDAQRP